MGRFQIKKKFLCFPQQDTIWCHLANLQKSVAQLKETVRDIVPAKLE